MLAWLLTLIFLAPRVGVEELGRREADAAWPDFKFLVVSRRWRRGLSDVNLLCALHIPHHQGQENVLALKATSTYFALVPTKWARIVILIPGSRIEVVVFASDPLSGARRTSHRFLVPQQ